MNNQNQSPAYEIQGIFPIPVYQTHRELDLDSSEKKDIEDIMDEGFIFDSGHSFSNNSYIFNTKLKKIKEFCEQHIKIYVKEIINPKEDLDFYITQSWLNVTKPGESHNVHSHTNSIISAAFYIQTDVGQTINCYDPNRRIKQTNAVDIERSRTNNIWCGEGMCFEVKKNMLMLFPSWLEHGVQPNKQQTKDVISISFNTFVKGNLGQRKNLNQLILQ